MPLLALLGARDDMFDALQAYLVGGSFAGRSYAAPGPLDLRVGSLLYAPPVIALRRDPRYAQLLQRFGLEDYWRDTGSQPDFRRG